MKLIIDIPEKVVTAIQNGEDYRYDIHTAIAQGIPYEERPQGDLISRGALKRVIRIECNPYGAPTIDYESGKRVLTLIDRAPTVLDRYGEGYAQGYIDGSTGADWRGEE